MITSRYDPSGLPHDDIWPDRAIRCFLPILRRLVHSSRFFNCESKDLVLDGDVPAYDGFVIRRYSPSRASAYTGFI